MKQVNPNLIDVTIVRFLAQKLHLAKFRKYWGVTTFEGHEVFKRKRIFYKSMDEDLKKLAKMLGMYESLSEKQKNVKSAWLKLDPDKSEDSAYDFDAAIVAGNLNKALKRVTDGVIMIASKKVNGVYVAPPITSPEGDLNALTAEVTSKYESFLNSDFPVFTNQEDGLASVILMYILGSSDIPYTVDRVEKVANYHTVPAPGQEYLLQTNKSTAWKISITLGHYAITPSTDIVSRIASTMQNGGKRNVTDVLARQLIVNMGREADEDSINDYVSLDEDGEPLNSGYAPLTAYYSEYWIRESGNKYYLKTSILDNEGLSLQEKIDYIHASIDTGYRKKPVNKAAIVAAVVIVIVAFAVAGPQAAAVAGKVVSAGLLYAIVAISITITLAAMYIRIAMLAMYYLGAENVTLSLSLFLQNIAPLVKISQVISIIASIKTIIDEGIRRAEEEAAKKALEEAGEEVARASIKDIVIEISKLAIETVTGIPLATDIQVSHAIKMFEISFDLYEKNQTADMQKKTENYRKELARLEEARVSQQVSDVVKDMAASYPNVLAKDASIYADRYDRPYEWWATPYHTGNIQATTINALWLS